MLKKSICLLSATLLVACSEAGGETTSTIEFEGQSYTVITETVTEGSRTFDVSRVRVNDQERQCDLSQPGDCEAAIQDALDDEPG